METEHRKQYIAGTVLLLAAAALVLAVFSLLSRTEKEDIYLGDSPDKRNGWRYELLVDGRVQAYEPVFADDYVLALPEGTEAVRITRTMEEDIPRAELEWMSYMDGVEVFLDDEPLHSDFPQTRRGSDGFVRLSEEDWSKVRRSQGTIWQMIRMSLPEDYQGRELSMITYFPEDGTVSMPEYPFLGDEDSTTAEFVVFSVRYDVAMTIYALAALLMAGMFLLDIHNNGADGKVLLLCLYFLMLFLNAAYISGAGYYSVLSAHRGLQIFSELYMMPLYLYLALRVTGRWKWPLCGLVAAWVGYEGVQGVLRYQKDLDGAAGSMGPGALLVFLAVAAAFCAETARQRERTRAENRLFFNYGLIAAALTAVYVFERARAWGSLHGYLVDGVWMSLSMGNCWPVITPVTDITSYMTVIVVVTEVVRRTIRTSRTVDVLRERSRLTMEGYERMLKAEEATNAANHEMRHHVTALAGILRDGDLARAEEYVSSLTDELDRLPTVRYSRNVLVNTIAGAYLDQAKAEGIRVECTLNVPAELGIADEDLSVFLTNLLENALHACRRIEPGKARYIRLKMDKHENFLFIGCTNSAADEQEGEGLDGEERVFRRHGYGLEAMRQIAEKYSSILLLDRGEGEFSVKSNFSLRPARASQSAGPRDG